MLGSGDEDQQPAITDGKENSQGKEEDVNKQQKSKTVKSKDQNSKAAPVKRSPQRKSNKRKQRETESAEMVISNGMSSVQATVTDRLPSQSDTDYETMSNSSSSPLPLASRQFPMASMSSASPDTFLTRTSPGSLLSSGPGSCEMVTSPESESSNDGTWMNGRAASLHDQNRNTSANDTGASRARMYYLKYHIYNYYFYHLSTERTL